jgi:hypothetical protein
MVEVALVGCECCGCREWRLGDGSVARVAVVEGWR